MARLAAPLLFSLLLSGCGGSAVARLTKAQVDTLPGGTLKVTSAGPTGWSDSTPARMIEEIRFSGAEGTESEIGQPRSLAVDESGRIYVVDTKPAVIKVFAPDGRFIRTMGREGEGPGEFRIGFLAARHGVVVLHDPQVTRTSVFDSAGGFLRSWPSSCCYWMNIQIDRDRRVYVASITSRNQGESIRGIAYVRWSLEGTLIDTIWAPYRETEKLWTVELKQGSKMVSSMATGIPFLPEQVHVLDPDGGFVHGWTGDYSIVRSRTGRDTVTVLGRGWTPDPLTDDRRREAVEERIRESAESFGEANVRSAFRLEDLPHTLPAFMNLSVDRRGRIWVRRYGMSDASRSDFDVFDSAGAWLGPVTVPVPVGQLQAWTEDGLVTIIEDAGGRPTVVRFRLELPPRVN